MRVYLPVLPSELSSADGLPPRSAHAVTSALRAALPDEDDEGLSFVATLAAADDAVELLRDAVAEPDRRVVVVADIAEVHVPARTDAWVEGDDALPSLVLVGGQIRWQDVVTIHADAAEAGPDVAAARADESRLDDAAEHDLLWFDVTEREWLAHDLRDSHGQ